MYKINSHVACMHNNDCFSVCSVYPSIGVTTFIRCLGKDEEIDLVNVAFEQKSANRDLKK